MTTTTSYDSTSTFLNTRHSFSVLLKSRRLRLKARTSESPNVHSPDASAPPDAGVSPFIGPRLGDAPQPPMWRPTWWPPLGPTIRLISYLLFPALLQKIWAKQVNPNGQTLRQCSAGHGTAEGPGKYPAKVPLFATAGQYVWLARHPKASHQSLIKLPHGL